MTHIYVNLEHCGVKQRNLFEELPILPMERAMIYRVPPRLIVVSLIAIGLGGAYSILRRFFGETYRAEPNSADIPGRDRYLPPPQPGAVPKMVERQAPQRVLLPLRPSEKIPAVVGSSTTTNMAEEHNRGNLENIPTSSISSHVSTFQMEQLYFSDGSMAVRVCDNSVEFGDGTCAGLGVAIGADEVLAFKAKEEGIIQNCYPFPDGGEVCFDALLGPEVTFFTFFDSTGDQIGGSVERGLVTAYGDLYTRYLEFLKSSFDSSQ